MKRACPYDISLLRKVKTHVMDYDIDENVLQKIHDDTIKKLKDGARLCNTALISHENPVLQDVSNVKGMVQTSVTNYFNRKESNKIVPGPSKIAQSNMMETDVRGSCFYCNDKSDVKLCSSCGESFCNHCYFTRYDGMEEEFLCLSCS